LYFSKNKDGRVAKCNLATFRLYKRNSGRNHEQNVVSTAKILGQITQKTILHQSNLSGYRHEA